MKVFPTNASNGSIFNTNEAKITKIFPTFGWNSVNLESFVLLNFVIDGITVIQTIYWWLL